MTFVTRQGRTFHLVGSHTSTVEAGNEPESWPECAGCKDRMTDYSLMGRM